MVGEWLKGLSPRVAHAGNVGYSQRHEIDCGQPPPSGQRNVVNSMVKVHLELEGEVAEVFWALCRTSWPVARSALDGFSSLGSWEGQLCIGCGMR